MFNKDKTVLIGILISTVRYSLNIANYVVYNIKFYTLSKLEFYFLNLINNKVFIFSQIDM